MNVSGQPVRILRFGGYQQTRRGWELSNVSRAFYSADEFREWYGLGRKEWLLPGGKATDTNNYGGRPILWVYYCESEDGTKFIAGSVFDK